MSEEIVVEVEALEGHVQRESPLLGLSRGGVPEEDGGRRRETEGGGRRRREKGGGREVSSTHLSPRLPLPLQLQVTSTHTHTHTHS